MQALSVKNTTWQLQKAKAMLSEVVKSAALGPQIITVRGEEKAIVLSMEDYNKLNRPNKPNLVEFFQNSPWRDVELELPERRVEPVREFDL
jgi:prevent-host-death family protein